MHPAPLDLDPAIQIHPPPLLNPQATADQVNWVN
jgi:hypothetical protein